MIWRVLKNSGNSERRAKINNKYFVKTEKAEIRQEFQDDWRFVLDTSIEERSKLKIDETEVAIEPSEIGAAGANGCDDF